MGIALTDAPADDREDEPGREEEVDAVGQEAQNAVCVSFTCRGWSRVSQA